MSELKTRFIDDTYAEYYNTGKHALAQVYIKAEADKVIADLNKEIARLDDLAHAHNIELLRKENLIAELKDKRDTAEKLLNKASNCVSNGKNHMMSLARKCNHANYKRCLAMAELCCERKENCYNIALRKYTKSEADLLVKKQEFWEEWEDTWTQLAYRFKETYNENKNQEEQTI